ncbi:GvpL/GvpF family gas vesicle protein [Kitasatospora cineracea]|uniref:GvpL/GvpF family gas vesicle protein n=1 Tax=Kitasatospora cineracea TaxID=88074 RepID=UPI0037B515C3
MAAAVVGGYFLGRWHKARWALALAGLAAGKRISTNPGVLIGQLLDSSPQLRGLVDEMRGDLTEAGKNAVVAAASNRMGSLTDRLQQQTDAVRDRDTRDLADAAARARQVHLALTGLADHSTEHPPQPPEATGVRDPMLLNGAYLVHRSREAGFARAVRDLREQHAPVLRLELTGPWPPYSFVDLPTGDGAP